MTIWKVSTTQKKMCEEREQWFHQEHDWSIVRINGYRWGTFTVETNDGEPPEDIDPENPDGINMYDYFSDNAEDGAELESMDDGCYMDWVWDEKMSDEDRAEVERLWEEDSYSGLEGAGWDNSETEAWLFGPLEITKES